MFLKFFILLVCFILAVNCMEPNSPEASSSAYLSPESEDETIKDNLDKVNFMETNSSEASSSAYLSPESEDENVQIIKDAFNCFSTMLTNTLGIQADNTAMSDCVKYMGGTLDYQITNDYFDGHKDRIHETINFDLFSEIFNYHCTKKPATVQECADNWKDDWNVQIIKDAFNCFTTMLTNTLGFQADNISMSDCVKYMGGTLDYQITNDYFDGHKDRIHEPLSLGLFSEIFNYHCTKKPATVQECADNWKDDWIIVDSFMDCKINHNRRCGLTLEAISTYTFENYVSLDKYYNAEFNAVEDYIERYFPLEPSIRDKWIGLAEFNAIFKHFCKVYKGLTIKVCAEQRKAADKIKTERVTGRIFQDRRTLG